MCNELEAQLERVGSFAVVPSNQAGQHRADSKTMKESGIETIRMWMQRK